MDKDKLIFTTDECIGCNKCIKSCPGIGVNSSVTDGYNSKIIVNPDNCIHCGTCLRNCVHRARRFTDDFTDFLLALENNEKIVLLIAPSFFLSFPDEAPFILGFLDSLGVYEIYDVSFGANITTWAAIKYFKETGRSGLISSACPVIVDYIEKYKPSLIDSLLPIMSPAGCLMTYLDYKRYKDDESVKYAFLGPCLGKHDEYTSYPDGKKFDYTFTFKTLFDYTIEKGINVVSYGRKECVHLESPGRGRLYPAPGGLAGNIKNFIDESYYIKQIEGSNRVYEYLNTFDKMHENGDNLPLFVDILNCEGGCNEGVATNFVAEDAELTMSKVHADIPKYISERENSTYLDSISKSNRFRVFDNYFSNIEMLDYRQFYRKFNTDNAITQYVASDDALNEVFITMKKNTPDERNINCTSCGYASCKDMATAIYFGFNKPENCVHYVKDELLANKQRLEQVLQSVTGSDDQLDISITNSEQIVDTILSAVNEVWNQREELNNTIHARTNMFANLTHELRTPLNAIMSMTELMDTRNLNQNQLDSIASIKTAGKGLLDTISEILDFSKLEENQMTIVEDKYNLAELFGEIVTVINFRCIEKKIQFIRVLDPSLPSELIGDYKRIRQVTLNILGNAVKYTNLGSVTINATWNKDKENPVLIISVTDTGMGIKKEDIPFLFDSYKQVNEKETRHIVGTGLGLSITKNLMESMGGNIKVESEYGRGSTFTLEIPQKIEHYSSISEALAKDSNMAKHTDNLSDGPDEFFMAPNYRALVVDDTLVNLQVARGFLDKMHIYSDIAQSGKEAVEMAEKEKYDILFIDHLMPQMNGFETIAEIKAGNGPNINTPIVYLSAMDTSQLLKEVGDIVCDYLEKPIKKEQLWKILRHIIPSDEVVDKTMGYIPSDADLRDAVNKREVKKLLYMYSAIEAYADYVSNLDTVRFIKKYRIMLQQGHLDAPFEQVEAVIARCHLLK